MRKQIEHIYCDKCRKETEEVHNAFYLRWHYELCNECFKDFKEFEEAVIPLEEQWKKMEQKYQYGEYFPKNKVGDIDG